MASADDLLDAADKSPTSSVGQLVAESIGAKPPAVSPWLKWPAVIASAVPAGLAEGIGAVGDLDALGNRYLPSWMTKNLLTGKPMEGTVLPTSSELLGATNSLGLTGLPIERPETPAQRVVAGMVGGAAAAAPLIMTGDPLGVLTAGAGAGGAAGATNELLPGNPLASTAVGFVGGLTTGSLANDARNLLALRSATKAASAAKESLTAAKEAKATGAVAADQAKAAALTKAQQAHSTAASSISPLADPHEAIAKAAWPKQTSGDFQTSGEAGQAAARKWLATEAPKRQEAAWSPVDKLIPSDAPVELPNYAGALTAITTKGARLGGDLKSPLFERLNSRLQSALRPDESVPGEPVPPKPLTWQDARELRSLLGDAMADPTTVKPIHQQDLANLYRSLTQDMGTKASQVSPEAAHAFNIANNASKGVFHFSEGPLAKLVSGKIANPVNDPRPGDAVSSLLNGAKRDAGDLEALRKELPDFVDSLGATLFRQKPELWNSLPQRSKEALAPGRAAEIDAALARHAADQAAIEKAKAAAKSALSDAKKSASSSTQATKWKLDADQRQAQQAYDAATQRHEAAKNALAGSSGKGFFKGVKSFATGAGLGELAQLTAKAMHLPGAHFFDNPMAPIIGAAAPVIARGVVRMVRKPRVPTAALLGAKGGTAAQEQ